MFLFTKPDSPLMIHSGGSSETVPTGSQTVTDCFRRSRYSTKFILDVAKKS